MSLYLIRLRGPFKNVLYTTTRENGWSKNVLSLQIENNLFARKGTAITNFKNTLPAVNSDLAQELQKPTTYLIS